MQKTLVILIAIALLLFLAFYLAGPNIVQQPQTTQTLPTTFGLISSFEQIRGENLPSDWFRTIETNMKDSDDIEWDRTRIYVNSEGFEGKSLHFNSNYDQNYDNFYTIKSKAFKVNPGASLDISYYVKNGLTCPYPAKDWECNGVSLYVFNNRVEHITTYDLFSFNDKFEYDCCTNFRTNVEKLENGWYRVDHQLDSLTGDAAFAQLRIIQYNRINQQGYYLLDNVVVL